MSELELLRVTFKVKFSNLCILFQGLFFQITSSLFENQ